MANRRALMHEDDGRSYESALRRSNSLTGPSCILWPCLGPKASNPICENLIKHVGDIDREGFPKNHIRGTDSVCQ